MRRIAHLEGRVPVLTLGTVTVILAGTVAGLAAGIIYVVLRKIVHNAMLRALLFVGVCEVIAWRGVHGLLARPQMMFMTLALIFVSVFLAFAESRSSGTSGDLHSYIGG